MKEKIVLLISLLLTVTGYSQTDTVRYNYNETKQIEDKLTIKRLSLADIVTKEKSIPGGIKEFKNLELLSLRPTPVSFGRPSGVGLCIIRYAQSKILSLPPWTNELKKLNEIDLIGINKIDYHTELKRLVELTELKTLSIEPDEFDDNLTNLLIEFKALKSLKIRASVTDKQLTAMKNGLPDCEIVTGTYADY